VTGSAPAWQRPPFEAGNTAALTHGAESPAKVNPRAEAIAKAAVDAVPYLGAIDFAPALRSWARAEASLELLAVWVDVHGLLDESGNPQPWVSTLLRFERLAAGHRARLGLDPASRAKLERDLADVQRERFDLGKLLEEGRKVIATRGETP
jgi:hypothetical protein